MPRTYTLSSTPPQKKPPRRRIPNSPEKTQPPLQPKIRPGLNNALAAPTAVAARRAQTRLHHGSELFKRRRVWRLPPHERALIQRQEIVIPISVCVRVYSD